MKLPSSPSIAYVIIYGGVFVVSIILNYILLPLVSSPLQRLYILDFLITCILFYIGNYILLSNNVYDLHWPLVPVMCSIYFPLTLNTIQILSFKHYVLFILIFAWSTHLIWQTITSLGSIHDEDWRYKAMRKQYKEYFFVFAFFALHILPMLEVLIGSSSLYYIYKNTNASEYSSIMDILLLLIIGSGVLLEKIADNQLRAFRRMKKQSRQQKYAVLVTGLWKYSRHPNYLGEILFWWGLFLFGCSYNASKWCLFGPLVITLMIRFGSIPMSEERLFRTYPDYKFVQQNVPMLLPMFTYPKKI